MSKVKIYYFLATVLIVGILVVLYFVFRANDKKAGNSAYPSQVLAVINNPAERITDNFSNIVVDNDFTISYGGNSEEGTFFIVVNAEPVIDVSKRAEKVFLDKLMIDQEYACKLHVILNIPSSLDDNLSEYDFGLGFCPDRPHIEDIPRAKSTDTRYYDDSDNTLEIR